MAALAIWEYNERSVQWVFGDSLHDSIDAKILGALRCSCEPLTNTDLHNLFNRNYNGNQIIEALGRLQRQGLVLGEVAKTPGKSGRPKQLWIATN